MNYKKIIPDYAFHVLHFLKNHRRFPNRNLISDYLFKLKTGGELTNPLRVFITDKEYLRLYVRAVIGDEFNVPLLSVLGSQSEVDDYRFPDDCCVKPSHASGEVLIRRGGAEFDIQSIKSWFDLNYYVLGRELNYKSLKPKIIVEPIIDKFVQNGDFRFFCVNGRVKMIMHDNDYLVSPRRSLFTADWLPLNIELRHPRPNEFPVAPDNLQDMIEVAQKLSSKFDFIRVDLYTDHNQCLVGELTNCHAAASQRFNSPKEEYIVSELLFS